MIETAARLGSFRQRCAGRRREQCIDGLMSKAGHLSMHKITTNHAFGEALLILLVNHSAIAGKIFFATRKEFIQRDLLFCAAALCMANPDSALRLRTHAANPFSTQL